MLIKQRTPDSGHTGMLRPCSTSGGSLEDPMGGGGVGWRKASPREAVCFLGTKHFPWFNWDKYLLNLFKCFWWCKVKCHHAYPQAQLQHGFHQGAERRSPCLPPASSRKSFQEAQCTKHQPVNMSHHLCCRCLLSLSAFRHWRRRQRRFPRPVLLTLPWVPIFACELWEWSLTRVAVSQLQWTSLTDKTVGGLASSPVCVACSSETQELSWHLLHAAQNEATDWSVQSSVATVGMAEGLARLLLAWELTTKVKWVTRLKRNVFPQVLNWSCFFPALSMTRCGIPAATGEHEEQSRGRGTGPCHCWPGEWCWQTPVRAASTQSHLPSPS